mgnify:CR=1 FL=1
MRFHSTCRSASRSKRTGGSSLVDVRPSSNPAPRRAGAPAPPPRGAPAPPSRSPAPCRACPSRGGENSSTLLIKRLRRSDFDRDVAVVLVALRFRCDHAVAQHLAVHADRRQRRLELVRDGSDEVAAAAPAKLDHHRHHPIERRRLSTARDQQQRGERVDVGDAARRPAARAAQAGRVMIVEWFREAVLETVGRRRAVGGDRTEPRRAAGRT